MAEESTRTSYEAAAAWEACRSRDRGEPLFQGDLLVLDLDRGGAGLCRCAGDGGIRLAGETPAEPIPNCFDRLGVCWGEDPRRNRTVRSYLRGRGRIDPPVLTLPSRLTITCSDLEERFQKDTGGALDGLLDRAEALLERLGTDRETLRILPVGALAAVILAEHRIRARFSADPFLPDPRFVDLEGIDPGEVVALGLARYRAGEVEQRRLLGHDVSLCLLEGWGFGLPVRPVEQPLARRDTPLEDLATPAFTSPFYLDAGDPLQVVVDGVKHTLSRPADAFPKGLLALPVQAALRADGAGMALILRGLALAEMQDCELPIPVGGEEQAHG